MRFGSTAKILLKCKLKYYRISECAVQAQDTGHVGTGADSNGTNVLDQPRPRMGALPRPMPSQHQQPPLHGGSEPRSATSGPGDRDQAHSETCQVPHAHHAQPGQEQGDGGVVGLLQGNTALMAMVDAVLSSPVHPHPR